MEDIYEEARRIYIDTDHTDFHYWYKSFSSWGYILLFKVDLTGWIATGGSYESTI